MATDDKNSTRVYCAPENSSRPLLMNCWNLKIQILPNIVRIVAPPFHYPARIADINWMGVLNPLNYPSWRGLSLASSLPKSPRPPVAIL